MSNTTTKYTINDNAASLCSGFLFWLERSPDAPALYINNELYSYRQLYNRALPVYEELKVYGQHKVGIYCTNDVHTYASVLAVALSGACYVPLNAKHPTYRLRQLIRDCGLKLIVTHDPQMDIGPMEDLHILRPSASVTSEQPLVPNPFIEQDLAYVLYTSGTTGDPKGVPVSKKNVNAFFNFFLNEYDFHAGDRFLQPYELSFDVSVFSIFCAWNAGASVYVVKDANPRYLEIFKTIGDHRITVCSLVPGVLKLAAPFLQELHFPEMRYSFFSGDALYQEDAQNWKRCIPNARLHNFYGPTETTIVCTRYCWNADTSAAESVIGIVPLGRPFPGTDFLLLNEKDEVASTTNPAGELCFSGEQVIGAYISERSADSFFQHEGKRWYRTGDWAALNKNGDLVFHGRKDTQVKIGGYRVELLEIENAIMDLTDDMCKVITAQLNGITLLVAFVEGSKYTEQEMREKLARILPLYMVPSRFIFVESFPKNENGKTDMNKLKRLLYA